MRPLIAIPVVLTPLLVGCRDDIVLKLPLRGKVGEPVDKTLEAKVGVDYQFWSDYHFVSPADAPGDRYCYQVHIDVVQGDKTVATDTCDPFPKSTCIYTSGRGQGDCETGCAFELAQGGPTTFRATLTRAERCDGSYTGLIDPDQIKKCDFLLEADD